MPAPSEESTHHLSDFAGFLSAVDREGFEFVVIGGCAVAAYSHLLGQPCFTRDLDLFTTSETLYCMIDWARDAADIEVSKAPQPRALQVAVLRWNGLEVNILCKSRGLPSPPEAFRGARVLKLKNHDLLEVPLVDPFDLLKNKLSVNREKDRPHIELLQQFLEEEVVAAFRDEQSQRDRLAPARRLMRVLDGRTLPESAVERMIPGARTPADFRFLVNHAPRRSQVERILESAGGDLEREIRQIVEHRTDLS